jgi:hypothetical protein
MNTKQRRTLEAIFRKPVPAQVPWNDIVSLFGALDATVSQRSGSRIAVALNGVVVVLHEPHPERMARRLLIGDVADFLKRAGVKS